MRGKLRKMLSMLLVLGMFLQDAQTLGVYAAEEIRGLGNRPNQELMELAEGVTEEKLASGEKQVSEEASGIPDEAGEDRMEGSQEEAKEPEGPMEPEEGKKPEGEKEPEEPLREPESYEPETEEPEGALVHYDEDSRTYYLGERRYRTVFGNSGTYLDEEGEVQLIDNTLAEQPETAVMAAMDQDGEAASEGQASPEEAVTVYGNTANRYQVMIPERLEEGRGIVLYREGWQMELVPLDGDYTRSAAKDNMILYNDVYPHTDVQYSVLDNSVKEDIILYEPGEAVYRYALYADGLTASQEEPGGAILLSDEEGNPVFALAAPLMEDAAGAVSMGLSMDLEVQEDCSIVTVTADEAWLKDEARVYPVRIDPTQTYVDAGQFGLYGVEEGSPDLVVGDNSYPYVGYDDGEASGNWSNYGKRHLRCRTYVGIDYDFSSLGENAKIENAYLNLCQITDYSGGSTQIGLYQVDTPWSWGSLTWNSQTGYGHTYLNYINAAPSRKGWLQFDLTEYVNNLVQGLTPNNGLVLKALDEGSQCEVYYNKTSSYGPSITVEWTEADPDDPFLKAYDLKDLLVNLRPVTEKSVDGKLKLDGVFADGLATAHAEVVYQLQGEKDVHVTEAEGQYMYPDSSAFEERFPEGTKYKALDSNWQTGIYTEFAFDTLYKIQAAAAKDGNTSGLKESDSFLVYQVKQYDTLPKIAAYYGVPLDQLLKDNRVQDVLVGKGNTLFIRNPKTNVPYTASLSDGDKTAIDRALMGRGLHCEFGFEPVNLNTGNFFLEAQDASLEDLGGEFAIERSYNSLGSQDNSAFGKGWSFNYEESLSLEEPGVYCYRRSDGSSLLFTLGEDGSYHAPAGYGYTLVPVTAVNDAGEAYNSRYEITDSQQTVRGFNSYGLMTDLTSRQGHKTVLDYDESFRLCSITSPSGKVYGIACDELGRIVEVTRPDRAVLSYRYDGAGNLAEIRDANGGTVSYQYDDSHRMVSWTDANGNVVIVNEYDAKGRVTKQTDANGNHAYFRYGDHSTVTVDNMGAETRYQYDDLYRTVSVTYPDGKTESKSYTGDNRLASQTDRAGNTTRFAYDGQGNLVTETRADGSSRNYTYNEQNLPLTETDYLGNVTSHTYDSKGNLLSTTTSLGNTTSYGYDELSRCVSQTDPLGDTTTFTYQGAWLTGTQFSDGTSKAYGYNEMGLLVSVTDELGRISSQSYDKAGNLVSVTSPEGNITRYTYDKAGQMLSEADEEGNTTRYQYDKVGNLTRTTLPEGESSETEYDGNYRKIRETDYNGAVTSYEYDVIGNAVKVTEPSGGVYRYVYDALGNVLSETDPLGNTRRGSYDTVKGLITEETDRAGGTRSYTYDGNGSLTGIAYGDGGQASRAYDGEGRLVSETDLLGNTKHYRYDGAGRLVEITDDLGTLVQMAYDTKGRLASLANGLGQETAYQYDQAGQLVSVTDANGHTTGYRYDKDGRQTAVTDGAGAVASYRYGKNGWLLGETDRNGNETKYGYNGNGNKISETDRAGYVTQKAYDGEGRLVSETDPLKQEEGFAYDLAGNLTAYTDQAGNGYTYTYDLAGNQTGLGLPDGRAVSYTYDGEGRLLSQTAANGLVTSYTYDKEGRILTVRDNAGGETSYTYDFAGNVTSETDALGNTTRYEYDQRGRLLKITYADESSVSYTYDGADRVAMETDQAGTVTEFSYDGAGNVTRILVNGEKADSYDYDQLNRIVGETDALSNRKSYTYDKEGNVLTATDENGITISYEYDSRGNLISRTDGNGGTEQYGYDALSRLVSVTDALGEQEQYRYDALDQLIQYQDKAKNVTEYQYDLAGNLVRETSPLGAVTSYDYDGADVLASVTDARGNVTSYENDKKGNVLRMVQANGGSYTYQYDQLGRMVSVTTPLDYTNEFTYDGMGRLVQQRDSLGRTSSYGYDVLGQLTAETAADGSKASYEYDVYGNRTAAVDALGYTTSYRYDLAGRLREEIDPLGNVTSYEYDPAGALTKLTRPGSRETGYQYDNNYNVTQVTDPMGYTTAYAYDGANRMTGETDALSHQQSYEYDVLGQVVSHTSKRGYTESYDYDAHGNVTAYWDLGGEAASYQYDLEDNMTRVTDARDGKTYYEYDEMNQLTGRIDALGRVSSYAYDAMGNLVSETDPAGRTKQYAYDPAGRMVSYTRPDGSSIHYDYDTVNNLVDKAYRNQEGQEAQDPVIYGYNARGERVSMSDEAGESSYTYDALGRIVTAKGVTGKELSYAYDEAGNLASITYPDGSQVNYTYDKNNNMASVTDGEGNTTSYRYDALNRLVRTERPNHTRTELGYDAEGNITSLVNIDSSREQEISRYSYRYDEMGYITEETQQETLRLYCGLHQFLPGHGRHHFLTGDGRCSQGIRGRHSHCCMEVSHEVTRNYTYDEAYQLIRVEEQGNHGPARVTSYTYDEAGNRTREKAAEGRCTLSDTQYVYNDSNQLIKSIRWEGWHRECTSYTYDENGNMTRESRGKCRETSYTYDMEDRLKTVYEGNRLLMAATYNGDGQKAFQLDYSPDNAGGGARSLFLPEDATEAEQELYGLITRGCGRTLDSQYLLTEYINDVTRENEEALMKEARNSYTQELAWDGRHLGITRKPLTEKYVYGTERICYTNSSGSGYYLYDALGNVRKEATAGGQVTASYSYDSYGRVTAEVRTPQSQTRKPCPGIPGPVHGGVTGHILHGLVWGKGIHDCFWGAQPLEAQGAQNRCIPGGGSHKKDTQAETYFPAASFGYRGEETNRNTGLVYLRYRHYSPDTANFTSEDNYGGRLGRPLSQNKYLYVEGNPLNYSDPSGHSRARSAAALAASIGQKVSRASVARKAGSAASKAAAVGRTAEAPKTAVKAAQAGAKAAATTRAATAAKKAVGASRPVSAGSSAGAQRKASLWDKIIITEMIHRDVRMGNTVGVARKVCGEGIGNFGPFRKYEQSCENKVVFPQCYDAGKDFGYKYGWVEAIIGAVVGAVAIGALVVAAGPEVAGALSGLGAWLGTGGGTAGMAEGMAVAGAGMTAEEMLLGLGKVGTVVGAGMILWEQIEANSKSLGDLVVQSSGGGSNNGESKSVRPESALTGSKKHGVKWKEGAARAKVTGNPQGQWAQSDLDYATEKANTLKPNESGYFDLPEGSQSIVHMPDGSTQPATRMWIRNNGTGTWHGYPMP